MMKRKIWSFVLATLLLVASVVNVGAANDPYSDYQFITTYACKVRAGTSTDYDVIASLPKGYVAYSDHSSSAYVYSTDRWVDLTVNNGWGWVRADLVCPANRCYEVTTTAGLRLRSQASTTAASLAVLPYGTYVEVLRTSGDFFYVRVRTSDYEPMEGYVHRDYVGMV